MDAIINSIGQRELPGNADAIVGQLQQQSGSYIPQEGLYWDFKREWPFSYSDSYFAGIARLISAFSNTHGGIIVFGVHDETRSAGHNKVVPNLDRLEQSLKTLLTEQPELKCRRYFEGTPQAIDVLLVCPLAADKMPTRFTRSISGYAADAIWVRQGSEVVLAEPRHVPFLYCRNSFNSIDMADEQSFRGGLPPSPATIKRFVGRMSSIDSIFRWLKLSDEPRTFLYGKGGSGKTTIAYEVAKNVKLAGSKIRLQGQPLDNVIFISAKQKALNVIEQNVVSFVGLDFSNERELYEAILSLSDWTSRSLDEYSIDEIKSQLRECFDITSNFIIIDDIDTLTTQGIEAGFDFLYSLLWRSKRPSKILYTIRNAPSHSLANSIEVRGLENDDYIEFVRVCAGQFKVPTPDENLTRGRLSVVSERRPLVLESIIALRRTSGNYEKALTLFEEDSGEDVRSYVFQREWSSLPIDNYGRYILAVLSLYSEPMSFDDIVALTRYEPNRVKDGLADIREMFLQINEVGQETTFQLGTLTSAFVSERSKKLDLYPALKERVEKYKRNFYPENPILSRLKDRIELLVAKGSRFNQNELLLEANQLINSQTSPKISEDPRFISLQAYVLASQRPPKLEDTRRLFGHVFAMKFEPDIEHLKRWFLLERDSGHGYEHCVQIADFIAQGRRYSDEDKIEFLSRKATNLYIRGKNDITYSPERALRDIYEALRLHLACYSKNLEVSSIKIEKSEEYSRNTAYFFFDFMALHSLGDELFKVITELCSSTEYIIDPIEEPLSRALSFISKERLSKSDTAKRKNKLEALSRAVDASKAWDDKSIARRLTDQINRILNSI